MTPSLEIRINSVADAKAVVSDIERLHQKIISSGADSVEYKIAEDCKKEVQPLIAGLVRVKTFMSIIKSEPNRILFEPVRPVPPCPECARRKLANDIAMSRIVKPKAKVVV